ncbi:MAG: transposase, partial [Gemmataceae bacterium]
QARQQGQAGQRRLRALAKGHEVLQAQGQAVGVPTACVLWVKTGDPRAYYAAAAYRKALGLNLVERSSGEHQGALHISKRGSAVSAKVLVARNREKLIGNSLIDAHTGAFFVLLLGHDEV